MTRAKKIIAAAASLVLALTAQPSKALCAETHTVTIIDFNGKVMTTLTVPHGSPVDFSKIDISSLEYHIDEYTQVGFNGWSMYPSSVTEDLAIYALFIRMNIECKESPKKTEYFSDSGNINTNGLNVTITKYTQLPQKDENGAFITKKDEINISETCTASPATIEEAFAKSDKAEVKITPPGSNKPILKYNITKTKGFGDINSDETVSSSDASAVLELYAKTATGIIESIDDKKMLICDINRDTSLDASDASIILDYYATSSTTAKELNWDVFFSDYSAET
ncbi:MAG: hypothetical protein IKJ60_05515 [Ruminococcus sp.]|nr:hypothetical protein [Ruminococcus sp.]